MANIAVFCGAREQVDRVYIDAAYTLGELIARKCHTLIYGGGLSGPMWGVYRGNTESGGKTVSVIPEFLLHKERSDKLNSDGWELIIVESMDERKKILFERSEVVIMLPWGIGTLDEFMEACTLVQLQRQDHALGILNTWGFYDVLIDFLRDLVEKKFMSPNDLARIHIANDPEELFTSMSL